MTVTLSRPVGSVTVEELRDGKRRVSLEPASPDVDHGGTAWETTYPVELIESVLAVKGGWVCDEIRRDEDPSYVERSLKLALLGYVAESEFSGKRLLDLGCGCGSSSIVLARLLNNVEIIGVELVEEFVELANERAAFHGLTELREAVRRTV